MKVDIAHEAKKHKYVYILLLFSLVYIIIFKLLPLFGLQLAFKEYNLKDGIWGSKFIGFDNFLFLFKQEDFWRAVKNTLVMGLLHLIFSFPIPIILAIFFSLITNRFIRKIAQLISIFPHFMGWILVASLFFNFFGNYGFVNSITTQITGESINFFSNPHLFRVLLIVSYIWKESGWNSIIFYAAICGIDRSLYEAAQIDGANKFQCIFKVTLPNIKKIIVSMFIIQVSNIFTAGFSQVFNLYNATVYSLGDIIETYIYRLTFTSFNNFGISAAASLLEGFANAILLISAELLVKKITGEGLFGELFFNEKKDVNAKVYSKKIESATTDC